MIVYRLSSGKYKTDLSGKGAEISGGRWNSKGVATLYTAQSRALAFSELAMHLPFGIMPKDYHLVSIQIPETIIIFELSIGDMPSDWRSNPHSDSTQKIGDQFITEAESLVLRVPSAVVPGDYNFLINPRHAQSAGIKVLDIEPFEFESRFALKRK
jgi:RES domain-containing protein